MENASQYVIEMLKSLKQDIEMEFITDSLYTEE